MPTDTSEKGLERQICMALTGDPCDLTGGLPNRSAERPADYGVGWIGSDPRDYDREYCVDLVQLSLFLRATQPDVAAALVLDEDGPTRRKFLARVQGEATKRGSIDVLRHGIKHGPHHVDLFYGTPSPGNPKAFERYYLDGADRDRLDPILDACVAVYREQLDEDGQVDFKVKAKAFVRTYGFLSQILPYTQPGWEMLSIFLNFLVPKLPAPQEEDLSKGILETIDMDSYRVEKQAAMKIRLTDEDAEIGPVPTAGGGHKPEPELDRLSNILKTFNDQFGNIAWSDKDRVHRLITEDIPERVAADAAYRNAQQNSDEQNARIEHDKALARVMTAVLNDDTELFKQFMDNDSFRRWMTDTVFRLTYDLALQASTE